MSPFRRCRKMRTMKERQAEVQFQWNPEMVEHLMRKEGFL